MQTRAPSSITATDHVGAWSAGSKLVASSRSARVTEAAGWAAPLTARASTRRMRSEPFVSATAGGSSRVAVAASTQPTHEMDVTGYQAAAIASLSEHAAYLAALDPRPVAEQAREVVLMTTGGDDGRARVRFEVFG